MTQDRRQRLKRGLCLPAGEGLKLLRTGIAKLDHGQKRDPRVGGRWQGVRLNMMARQPADGMAEQCLKDGDHARLKTDKADYLVNYHNVIDRQTYLIKLVSRLIINDVR